MQLGLIRKLFFFLGLAYFNCNAQDRDFSIIDRYIQEGKNASAFKFLDSLETTNLSKVQRAQLYLYKAKAYENETSNNKAFEFYIKSKKAFLEVDSIEKAMSLNIDIAYLLQFTDKKNAEKYVKDYISFTKKIKKNNLTAKGYSSWACLLMEEKPKESLTHFKTAIHYNTATKDDAVFSHIYSSLGVLYNEILQKPDSALFYIKKSAAIALKNNDTYKYSVEIVNEAGCYYYKKEYLKAIELLKKAALINKTKNDKGITNHIYYFLALNYNELGDYENAYNAISEHLKLRNELHLEDKNIQLSEFHTKYKSQEKELENLTLKNRLQRNQIIVYSFTALLFVLLIIAFLVYNNILKKKKIAEQEKLIETQKLEKTLKDQELHDIDLILESQEKERQQIANELHDNLGSMLATLKLNFENLKRNEHLDQKEQHLYQKTDNLIEEAYQKVRNISHLKNLGVIGSEGLLVAVKKMAEKMSILERLKINVIPFGLTERLHNQTEVFLFRMIQELCTNIIKHSGAKEVNIYMTQHDSNQINIIIEDNGNGFDPKKINPKGGIGLKSIEKKVEQLGGSFTIDSILTKGTTIIIDLPL